MRELRTEVLDRIQNTDCCTHLNDALRALAEVPVLAASLPLDVLETVRPDRLHVQHRHAALLERRQPVLHEALVADQVHPRDQLVGDERRGFLLLAGQVQVLDLVRFLLVAVPAETSL